jgi:methylated-DNA-protein-cysteine methyltransferase-like protein
LPQFCSSWQSADVASSFAFGGSDAQLAMLESEGVTFLSDGTVDMNKHLWSGELKN